MSDGIHRPVPRRPYDIPSDISSPTSPDFLSLDHSDNPSPPKRSRSTVSLTASTLFGIYGKTYTDELSTPSQLTRNNSAANLSDVLTLKPLASLRAREDADDLTHHPPPSAFSLFSRIVSLFTFGIAYGAIVTHLHERSSLSPADAAGVSLALNRWSPQYLVFWGLAGVGLGSALPWLDGKDPAPPARTKRDWNPAIRSIGAFVGIAYAIRRLPWQSTLQVSLALMLVNPFLWFLVDRTCSGLWFASFVGIAGTAFLLRLSPDMIQAPVRGQEDLVGGIVPAETVALGAWIASVLFCSCVCFGNVGRRLAPKGTE